MNINFTVPACEYIKKMLFKENGIGFRLTIKKTGCSGYSYAPEIIQTANATDTLIEQNGINIYIDPTWQHLLDGVQIDYQEEDKSGLKQKKLIFSNSKEANRCGCGESFHVS